MANEIEIIPGTPQFNKIIFKLNDKITPHNISMLNYNQQHLKQIKDNIYIMPAYINKDVNFSIFFVVTKLIQNDWMIAFSITHINTNQEITDLSKPIPTGRGLNMISQYNAELANQLLKYFNTLIKNKCGDWRLIQ